MKHDIPAHFKLSYSSAQIADSVERLAKEVTPWAAKSLKDTGQQVLAVCVLRGGAIFFSDLIRAVNASMEPTYCRSWSYSSAANTQSDGVRVAVEDVKAAGRSLLVIDDICDTGATLLRLQNVFLELGAHEVRTAVLIHRVVENSVFTPTWTAFQYTGPEWFVGYGMEDKNHFSNLPEVYTIKPS